MSSVRPMSLRARVTAAAALVLLVSVGTVILIGNVLLARGLHQDESVVLVARADALAASTEETAGKVVVENRPSDPRLAGRAWVYSADGAEITAPLNGGIAEPFARRLRTATRPTEIDIPEGEVRLRAVPAFDSDTKRRIATVVVAVSTRPYEFTRKRTLFGSLVLGLLVLIIGSAVAWRAVGSALRPVAAMARDAEEWSEHDLDRRFGRGPARDELGSLATTLDGLLGRIAASRRHEQRFSAEMAHELRTPLTAIRGEAELLERRAADPVAVRAGLADLQRLADRMAGVVDTLMGVARDETAPSTGGTGDARLAAQNVTEAVAGAAAASDVVISLTVAPNLPAVGSPAEVVERALQPLVDNAIRHAKSTVDITVDGRDTEVWFTVQDDGDGVDEALRDDVFEPGVRGENSSGVGLGLALARRLALGCEGDVQLEPSDGGARFVLRLPGAGLGGPGQPA
ncbi:MAG: HAMP domain-containing sensor histidine kinase [Solirubrobacteraceae bacterium]|nr:HAMP domain-containing sensor histidine kinase [Solirubrobacteraceae bacterium]